MAPEQLVRVLVDRRPTNLHIREKGEAGYCCDVVLCIEGSSGYILSSEILKPEDGDETVGAAAQEALDQVLRSGPELRVVWVVRQDHVAKALAARFSGPQILLEAGHSFALWDEAYLTMDRSMGSGGIMLPYLWRGDITPNEVGALFEAAAGFYRMRPWQFVSDTELLEMPSPHPGQPRLLISVMGAAGISRGLALFDRMKDFERVMEDRGGTNAVFAGFERVDKVPHTVKTEAERHGWVTVNKSAFPEVVRLRKGEPAPCSGDDLRRVTAAFQALGEATNVYRQSRKRRPGR